MRVSRCHSRSISLRASSGRSRRVELGAQLLEPFVRAALRLAELLLDGLELLAQVHLALAAADLFLDLGLDVLLGREHVDLALHVDENAAQPVFDRERLEKDLLGSGGNVEVSGHEVRQAAGLVDLGEDLLDGLVGQPEPLAELGSPSARLAVQAGERGVPRIERQHLLRVLHRRLEEALLAGRKAQGDAPRLAFEDQTDPAEPALDRADRGDRPDRVELRRGHVLRFAALGNGEDLVIGRSQRRFDCPQRAGPAGGNREGDAREKHGVPHRNDRQRLVDRVLIGHRRPLSLYRSAS